jgi:ATP/maltotriose-dependent transcriptional regulator MalT
MEAAVVEPMTPLERARHAVAREAWPEAYSLLSRLAEAGDDASGTVLGPDDFDALADAAWWLCRVEESLAARRRAYAAFAAAGAERRAGACAWMVFYEHHLAGRPAVAAGWLARARRHLAAEAECVEHAYVAFADAFLAHQRGDLDLAAARAREMTAIARRCGSADLAAMGLQTEGAVLLARGERTAGFALVDEAMCAVLAGELSSLFTGWIYCLALPASIAAADLRRAGEWTEEAMAWCASLPAGTPFHGLCRVHRVEVLHLRGAWAEAAIEAARACDELLAYDPRVAAEAFYVAGEIGRRRGDLGAAEEAYRRAHELGRDPQPGLALLRLAQGKAVAAASALRTALSAAEPDGVGRARLLAAYVEVTLATGDVDDAQAGAAELTTIADGADVPLLHAMAAMGRGAVRLARQDQGALPELQRARTLWQELGLPDHVAQTRMLIAAVCRSAGDQEGARLELSAARAAFARLGAAADARRADALLRAGTTRPAGLTEREVEVLRLVAAGRSNRSIAAELVVSEHTVARHLNNIFAKLGVSTRSAATAFAFTHELV